MSSKEQRIESEVKCINKVAEVVREKFNGEFLEFPQRTDNGFDGVIIWREKGNVVDVIYVQCKGGESYLPKNREGLFRVQNMTRDYVSKHKEVWSRVASPAILVVTDKNKKAWWTDLKDDRYYDDSGEELYIQASMLFNSKTRVALKNLLSKKRRQIEVPMLRIRGNMLSNYLGNESLKSVSKSYYKELGASPILSKCPELSGKVKFTRVGWRHITRKTRNRDRIIQSLLLLPTAKEIISNSTDYEKVEAKYYKDKKTGNQMIIEKLIVDSDCSFHYRFPAIVRIVLLRKREFTSLGEIEKIWFYSIYERRRKESVDEFIG